MLRRNIEPIFIRIGSCVFDFHLTTDMILRANKYFEYVSWFDMESDAFKKSVLSSNVVPETDSPQYWRR